ncbi:molybdopterin-guanine dinucleotide biosynthesis protein B [Bosea sp. CRIB-10]|uniref:molybdopterin-guanine dinucleotide biosynthesis protein B n=1 Tax=Bosea sp. CRIB-10 TaxID=378404 RepID=UPI0008E180C6|nr:molybdopterin-guanine dinucleotide biosynthesis protein B [Bosea sp. CRIB-10]SFB99438.1 molybdopterin-guanine dinucleotide biosynthesis protein B [Bosea sp. CRIB-10]
MRVIGLAGWSGAGKTSLLTKLIPEFSRRGVRVSTIKHAHHAFDLDTPGKDSWAHRQAGASEVLISSAQRWALLHELRGEAEATLPELLARLSPVDLVIVEGFKRDPHAKLEVYRAANAKPPLHPDDPSIVAIASDTAFLQAGRPVIGLEDIPTIADCLFANAQPLDAVLSQAKGRL